MVCIASTALAAASNSVLPKPVSVTDCFAAMGFLGNLYGREAVLKSSDRDDSLVYASNRRQTATQYESLYSYNNLFMF